MKWNCCFVFWFLLMITVDCDLELLLCVLGSLKFLFVITVDCEMELLICDSEQTKLIGWRMEQSIESDEC